MKYMGSKARFVKELLPIILKGRKENQTFVDLTTGGANVACEVGGSVIANDNNKYLIAMWKAFQQGYEPPKFITREFYSECRDIYNRDSSTEDNIAIIGYVGFNGSYGGRFFDGGYAGKSATKTNNIRNYPLEAYNNVMKQIPKLNGISFTCEDYRKLIIPDESIIYCDIQYKESKQYKSSGVFDYDMFYNWCREKKIEGHKVFVSERSMPSDFKCVWQKEAKSSLSANGRIGGSKTSIEKLFTL